MIESDPPDPETGRAHTQTPAEISKTRGIRFPDSEWEEVRNATERNDVPVAEFVRETILRIARGCTAADTSTVPADLAPLIGRTFRYTYMLATLKRDELIRDGRGDEMETRVKAARELQHALQQGGPS